MQKAHVCKPWTAHTFTYQKTIGTDQSNNLAHSPGRGRPCPASAQPGRSMPPIQCCPTQPSLLPYKKAPPSLHLSIVPA